MDIKPFYVGGTTRALTHCAQILSQSGLNIRHVPCMDTGHLLLDVPSFRPGNTPSQENMLHTLLCALPRDIIIWGGNLDNSILADYRRVDLLKDEGYLLKNAAITARCALKLALPLLHTSPQESPILIIGWGRIGRQLSILLNNLGYPIFVASRKDGFPRNTKDSACSFIRTEAISDTLPQYRLIFNTAPVPVLSAENAAQCIDCIKMDLASIKGIEGDDVIWARGLPGIHAPEESGMLIANTILNILKEESK